MAWTILVVASAFEILFALGLKTSHGFTRLWPSVGTVAAGVTSFVLLSQALKTLPVGTGYAAWTGIGAVGSAVLGIVLFHEPRDATRRDSRASRSSSPAWLGCASPRRPTDRPWDHS